MSNDNTMDTAEGLSAEEIEAMTTLQSVGVALGLDGLIPSEPTDMSDWEMLQQVLIKKYGDLDKAWLAACNKAKEISVEMKGKRPKTFKNIDWWEKEEDDFDIVTAGTSRDRQTLKRKRESQEQRPKEQKFVQNKNFLATSYKLIQQQMQKVLTQLDATKYPEADKYDHNLQVIGTGVVACYNNYSQFTKPQTVWICVTESTNANGTKQVKMEKADLNYLEWANRCAGFSDEERKQHSPFFASLQICAKNYDAILWQDNQMLVSFGISAALAPFAVALNIQNKFKKSRSLSVGPIAHLIAAYSTYRAQQNMPPITVKGNQNMPQRKRQQPVTYKSIMDNHHRALRRQLVSPTQREGLSKLFDYNEWELMPMLATSMLALKPHIEHNFVLPFPVLYVTTDFQGATMTNEFAWKTMEAATGKFYVTMGTSDWFDLANSVWIHCCFGSMHEDLAVMECLITTPLPQRKTKGRFVNSKNLAFGQLFTFNYIKWSKPQKGAPISQIGSSSEQIVDRPCFRGKRRHVPIQGKLADYVPACASKQDFKDKLEEEWESVQGQTTECSGDFYDKGTTNKTTINPGPRRLMFSNQ